MDLLSLIHQKSYEWAVILLIMGYLTWFIYYKLSFKIINGKMPLTIIPAIMIMVAYVVCARPYIQGITFLILMCVLMVILLCIFGRLNIYKSIYGAFFTIFLSFLGNVFVLSALLGLYPKLIPFIFGSKFGFVIGNIFEVMFPLIALYLVPKYSLRLPLRKVSEPFDLFDMAVSWTLLCMYYVMDFALMTALEAFQKNHQKIGSSLGLLLIATLGIIGGVILIIKYMKIMHDREIKRLQTENEKIESEKNILIDKLKKAYKFKNLDNDEQLSQIVGDFVLDLVSTFRSSEKKQIITPNEINLRKLGINSQNGVILGWIILDKTYQEIADLIHLSEPAVRTRASDMIKAFGLKNRKELAQFAIENNLVEISNE